MSSVFNGMITVNHCDLPPWIIASCEFNTNPEPLRIAGVRESNSHLFRKLNEVDEVSDRGRILHEYLAVKFALSQSEHYTGNARRSLRNSYIRFLRGWGMDSNGVEGAVLKSWVQSRFGIYPTYHRGMLDYSDGEEDQRFAYDRMKGSSRSNAIYSQLDLLYEFCQYEIARRWGKKKVWNLFRGTNDPEEHPSIAEGEKHEHCVRLNNLVSFTSDREKAWEFGSTVWKASVAYSKIIFFSGLLPDSLLYGEDEYLVIGGDYWVKEILY